jgi:hypothetical protein
MGGAFEQSCGLASYGPAYESFELTCDGLDNDCEGRADRSSFVEVAGDVGHFDWVVVDGGFLAAYDAPIDDGGRRAYLRRFDSRLAPMGAPVDLMGTVITFPPHYGERPRLLPTDAGVLVAWLEQPSMRDGGVDIVLGRADEQGELVPIGMGTATSTLVASVPDVTGTLALASTDTRVAIGWVEPLINGPLFRALSMSLDGVPTSPIKTLSSLSGVADSIDLTGLGRTGFFAAWNDSLKVRWQRYDDQLTATSSVDTSNLAGPASQITTRKLKEGEPLLAFIANEVPQFYVVVLPGLSSPSQTVPILGRGVPLLRVTELRQGEFAVAGTTFDSVWGAVLNASGTLGAPVSLVPDAGAPITQLALAGRNQSIAVAVTFPAEPVAGASSQRVVGERACLP